MTLCFFTKCRQMPPECADGSCRKLFSLPKSYHQRTVCDSVYFWRTYSIFCQGLSKMKSQNNDAAYSKSTMRTKVRQAAQRSAQGGVTRPNPDVSCRKATPPVTANGICRKVTPPVTAAPCQPPLGWGLPPVAYGDSPLRGAGACTGSH